MPLERHVMEKIGLALGSGSSRGWAHIGIIRALEHEGIIPDVVCGTSVGALVGAAYACGNLDALEKWILGLDRIAFMRLMDLGLRSGGLVEGSSMMGVFKDRIIDGDFESLPIPFAAATTNLEDGQEICLNTGPLITAVRASMAYPGLFSPVRVDGMCLVDGGLVAPVPINLCRTLGANKIIAVNLNDELLSTCSRTTEIQPALKDNNHLSFIGKLTARLSNKAGVFKREQPSIGIFDVMTKSINVMQDRITRHSIDNDGPDVVLSPQLGSFKLLDYERAGEAIEEGYACVSRVLPEIKEALRKRPRKKVIYIYKG